MRIDHGIAQGDEVSPYYDAMVAKLIVHGRDRGDAIRRLRAALQDAPLLGLQNNGRFLHDLLAHPQFAAATMTTTRLDEWALSGEALLQRTVPSEDVWQLAAALRARPGGGSFDLTLVCDGVSRTLRAPCQETCIDAWQDCQLRYTQGGVQRRAIAVDVGSTLHLSIEGASFTFTEPSPYPSADKTADASRARAPVAGVVAQVLVAVGDVVTAGQPMLCVEAMKMEMWLNASATGTVRAVHAQAKDPVAAGTVLIELENSQ